MAKYNVTYPEPFKLFAVDHSFRVNESESTARQDTATNSIEPLLIVVLGAHLVLGVILIGKEVCNHKIPIGKASILSSSTLSFHLTIDFF